MSYAPAFGSRPWRMKTVSSWPISAFWPTDTLGHRPMTSCFLYRRREFITLLGGAAAAWPLAARAQSERMRRIGVLLPANSDDADFQSWVGVFLQTLALSGWTIGHNMR